MATFYDRVKMTVAAAPGTGAVTLGAATPGYRAFADAGVADQATVSYVIEDGVNWELGHGTYTAAGTSLARTTIVASSNAGAAIAAGASAVVYLTLLAEDLAALVSGGGSGGGAAVAPTLVQSSPIATTQGNSSTLAAAMPAAVTAGNLLVAFFISYGFSSVASGWTLLSSQSGSDSGTVTAGVAFKVAAAGDGATLHPFNPPGSGISAIVYEVSGCTAGDLAGSMTNVNAVSANNATSATATLTGLSANTLVLGAALNNVGYANPVFPAGVLQDAGGGGYIGDYYYVQGIHKLVTAAGGFSTSYTLSDNTKNGYLWLPLVALQPH